MYQRKPKKNLHKNYERRSEAELLLAKMYSDYEDVVRHVNDLMFTADNTKIPDLKMFRSYLDRTADNMVDIACWLSEERCDEWCNTINRIRSTIDISILTYINNTINK